MHELEFTIFSIAVIVVAIPMVMGFVGGAPYVPTPARALKQMAKLARIRPTDHVMDPGCGDGRLLSACLDAGAARATGYELFLPAFFAAWIRSLRYGKRFRVRFFDSRLTSLRNVDVLVCYLLPDAMMRWAPKFERELPIGARIVSYTFEIPGWKAIETVPWNKEAKIAQMHLYVRGESEPTPPLAQTHAG